MALTRDLIQGFIDGYITVGGDPSAINDSVSQYLSNHPTYKASEAELTQIVSDIASYRVTSQDKLAPAPVLLIPGLTKAI